jgi:hypothetical protein
MVKLYEIHNSDAGYVLKGVNGELLSNEEIEQALEGLYKAYESPAKIYFIRASHEDYGELIKCGITTQSITKRMSQLKHSEGVYSLEIIGEFHWLDWKATYELEQAIHEILSPFKAFGEWYHNSKNVKRLIAEICKQLMEIVDTDGELAKEFGYD